MRNAPMMNCPHCGASTAARSSKTLSKLLREIRFQCQNTDCGHIFIGTLEASRTLSPSAIPDPEVSIPLSQHIRLGLLAQQINEGLTARNMEEA